MSTPVLSHRQQVHPFMLLIIVMLTVGLVSTLSLFRATAAAAEEVTTVSLWHFSGQQEMLAKLVEHFNTTIGQEKGIRIELTNHGRQYRQVLMTALETGNLPDIFLTQFEAGMDTPALVKQNRLLALNDLPGGNEFAAQYAPAELLVKGVHTYQGKIYSVPSDVFTLKLVYNKALFVEAGIVDAAGQAKPPTTWAEARDAAKKISQLHPGETFGFIFPMKGAQVGTAFTYVWLWKVVRPFIGSIGHDIFDHQQGQYNFPAFRPALEFMTGLKADGSMVPNQEVISDDAARIQFGQQGNVGMYIGASWDVNVFNTVYPATIDWGVAEMPVLDPAQSYKQSLVSREPMVIATPAQQKNLAHVLEAYQYLHGDYWQTVMYEDARFIPARPRIIAESKTQSSKKGWVEFARIENTMAILPTPEALLTLAGPVWEQVLQAIYDGQTTLDDGLADLDRRYNDAYQQAIAQGTIDPALYHYPDYDRRMQP